ncbi:nuclear transport factor 2 family protein [Pseudooctadecabacter sp.]|uniref:nuclear transport factor 2 family protein n=1 Tax=Pseudooctadecabacter sp. TaxID=1966338 RepID=UPI0035C7C421
MDTALTTFFAAWGEADVATRRGMIADAIAEQFTYSDPRCGDPLTDLDAMDSYVAQFVAAAPGWTATVTEVDGTGETVNARVAFSGPDGKGGTMTQHGHYTAQINSEGRITAISGVAEGQA